MDADGDLAVLIFARAPQPGQVKTRLIPALGVHGAATLQANMTRHALAVACEAAIGDVEMWCTPSSADPYFARCRRDWNVSLQSQIGDDLGERMRHAHDSAFERYRRIVVMGTDCPLLTGQMLRAVAADAICHDAVIIPAEDGGYVLIALSRPCPEVFESIDWGSDQVLARTLARLHDSARSYCVHAPLWDIDRPEDLRRLEALMPQLMQGL